MLRTLPIQNWFTFHSTIKNTEVVIFLTKLVVLKNVDLRPVWYYYLCKVRSERVKGIKFKGKIIKNWPF